MAIEKYYALRERKPGILGQEFYAKYAVLLPLVEHEGQICILFEQRAKELKKQPGEICFPGGRIESSDQDAAAAAIRETCEELGIEEKDIVIIAPLDCLVTPFNVIIYPFLCEIKNFRYIRPNHGEVESVFCVPLEYFLSTPPLYHYIYLRMLPPEDFPYELIPRGKEYDWREGIYPEYFYKWKEHVIWGMTARILHHFLALHKALHETS